MPGDDAYPGGPSALVDPEVVHVSRAADSADLQRADSARGPTALATALDTALAQPGGSAQHAASCLSPMYDSDLSIVSCKKLTSDLPARGPNLHVKYCRQGAWQPISMLLLQYRNKQFLHSFVLKHTHHLLWHGAAPELSGGTSFSQHSHHCLDCERAQCHACLAA